MWASLGYLKFRPGPLRLVSGSNRAEKFDAQVPLARLLNCGAYLLRVRVRVGGSNEHIKTDFNETRKQETPKRHPAEHFQYSTM